MKLTAKEYLFRLEVLSSEEHKHKIERYFKSVKDKVNDQDYFKGVPMGQVFLLSKEFIELPLLELEKLLDSPVHEARVGALKIMDIQARKAKTTEIKRKEFFDLYLKKHNRINNWDLVDVSAIYLIGAYLYGKPKDILYKLAYSDNIWERRTAIVSTAYFIKKGDVTETFKIAEILLYDKEDLINKPVGGWLRQAGKGKYRKDLLEFLDKYAATMPRSTLRYAIEHFCSNDKKYYMNMKANSNNV